MPVIPDNTSQDTATLIQLIQANRANKQRQFSNVLSLATPGQTIQELGITPEQYKEATGTELKPGQLAKDSNVTDQLDTGAKALLDSWKKDPTVIDKATPGSLDAVYTGFLATKLGLSGDLTGPGLKSTQQTAQTRAATGATVAQTQSDLVSAGKAAWEAADTKTKGIAGQQLGTGMTTSGIQSTETNQLLDIAVKKQGLKMVSDPSNPAWAPIKALGINPVMAVSAAATGILPLLDQYAQMVTAQSVSRSASESAISKANAEWATKVSEAMGGKLPPGLIAKVMNDRMAGKPPASPQEKAIDALIDNATSMAYQAATMDAFMKGNPVARNLPDLIRVATSKTNTDQFNILASQITAATSEALATQALGPRPLVPGPERQKWDTAAAVFQQAAPKGHQWWQNALAWPMGNADQTPGGQPNAQPAPSGGGLPASAAPSAPGSNAAAPTAPAGQIALPGAPAASTAPARPAGPSVNDLTDTQKAALAQILPFVMQGMTPQQPKP